MSIETIRRMEMVLWVALLWFHFPESVNASFLRIQLQPKARTSRFSARETTQLLSSIKPIDASGWPDRFPAKEHCSRCGLCETSFVSQVTDACAFLGEGMGRMDAMEVSLHGRGRDLSSMVWSSDQSKDESTTSSASSSAIAEEARFGVLHKPVMLAQGVNIPNAQWTGCVTGIALSMLESGMVDAVVCIANKDGEGWSTPEPVLARTADDVLKGRGVKPALAPSLAVLDKIKNDKSIKKLLFCGVGCAVQAFRAVQHTLELDEVFVLGTNCADNSPTPEAAQNFIENGVKVDATKTTVRGYEFMQDFKVHVKTEDSYITTPYFTLPGTIAESSIATSCLACFDYTNGLADVVVGYMGAPHKPNQRMDKSFQTITIRNERGETMVQAAVDASRLRLGEIASGSGSHEKFASATVSSDSIVMAMTGGQVKENGVPGWMAEIMAFAMRNLGPKGINFARYSIDYHILRNYLHVLDKWGENRAKDALPDYALDIVKHYLESDEVISKLKNQVESDAR